VLYYAHQTSCLLPDTRAAGLTFGVEAIAEYNLRDGDDAAVIVVLAGFCAMVLLRDLPTKPTQARMDSNEENGGKKLIKIEPS
jgi:hypothetical protein